MIWNSKSGLLSLFLIIRILMAFASVGWYVPDETWQSVEIAHGIVWPGYGLKTWEWETGLRSYLHPLLFVPVFGFLKFVGADSVFLVSTCPRILQAVISAFSDVANVVIFHRFFSNTSTDLSIFIFVYAFNWFLLYSSSRTIINQIELVFTSFALYSYKVKRERFSFYICWVVLSFMIRPTTGILWAPLVVYEWFYSFNKGPKHFISTFLLKTVPVCLVLATLAVAVDSYFYGKLTIVPWNFFIFNIAENVSSQYGTNHLLWYFYNAFPTIFGPLGLTFIPIGLWKSLKQTRGPPKIFVFSIVLFLIILSLVEHKEHRFMMPIVPLLICYEVNGLKQYFTTNSKVLRLSAILYAISNLLLAIYLSIFHQTGITTVIANTARNYSVPHLGKSDSLLFLTPCHAGPLYSHLHLARINVRYLECPPRLTKSDDAYDEAESFFLDPIKFLTENKSLLNSSQIVIFDNLKETIERFISGHGFHMCGNYFHSILASGRVGKRVYIYCKS